MRGIMIWLWMTKMPTVMIWLGPSQSPHHTIMSSIAVGLVDAIGLFNAVVVILSL
jgi:hypothetical protein